MQYHCVLAQAVAPCYTACSTFSETGMLKAVLFDMDGTLGDTLPLCVEAYRRCVGEQTGRTPSEEEVVSWFGLSDRGVLGGLLGMPPDAPALPIERFVAIYEQLHGELAPEPFPGAVEMLKAVRAAGLRVGLISGKEHYTALPTMSYYGMEGIFERYGLGLPTHGTDFHPRHLTEDYLSLYTSKIYRGDFSLKKTKKIKQLGNKYCISCLRCYNGSERGEGFLSSA